MIFLYRKNGGQVLGVTTDANAYVGIDAAIFATVTDPPTPNGVDLSTAKIYDLTNLRNATAPEITAFATAAAADQTTQDRAAAIADIQDNLRLRKILGAIVGVMVDEINILRQQPTTVFAARTLAQAVTAVVNKINSGLVD